MDYGYGNSNPVIGGPTSKPSDTEDFVRGKLGQEPRKRVGKISVPKETLDLDEAEMRGQTIKPGMTVTLRISGRVSSVSRKGFDIETDSAEFEGMTGEAEAGMMPPAGGMPPGGM